MGDSSRSSGWIRLIEQQIGEVALHLARLGIPLFQRCERAIEDAGESTRHIGKAIGDGRPRASRFVMRAQLVKGGGLHRVRSGHCQVKELTERVEIRCWTLAALRSP